MTVRRSGNQAPEFGWHLIRRGARTDGLQNPMDACRAAHRNFRGLVLLQAARAGAGFQDRACKPVGLQVALVVFAESLAQCAIHLGAVPKSSALALRLVMEKQPELEAGVTNCRVNALPSRLAQRLGEIPNVGTSSAMIDVEK